MQEKDRKKAIDNLTLKQLETLKLIELGQDKSDTFQRKPVNTGKGKQIHDSPVHNDAPKLLCSNQVVENNSEHPERSKYFMGFGKMSSPQTKQAINIIAHETE